MAKKSYLDIVHMAPPEGIDYTDRDSLWTVTPTNHRLQPGGRDYARYLAARKHITPGSFVLDVGCNCGQFVVNLTKDLRCYVVGVDIVPQFIEHCRQEKNQYGAFYCADFSRTAIEDFFDQGTFDYVTAFEVIEHAISVRGFLENVRCALRPGGKLIVSTPDPETGYDWVLKHDIGHVRQWSPWRLRQVFGPGEIERIDDGLGNVGMLAVFGELT